MLYLHTYARHVGRLFAGVLFFSPHVMHLIGQWLTYTIPGTRGSLRRRGGGRESDQRTAREFD